MRSWELAIEWIYEVRPMGKKIDLSFDCNWVHSECCTILFAFTLYSYSCNFYRAANVSILCCHRQTKQCRDIRFRLIALKFSTWAYTAQQAKAQQRLPVLCAMCVKYFVFTRDFYGKASSVCIINARVRFVRFGEFQILRLSRAQLIKFRRDTSDVGW